MRQIKMGSKLKDSQVGALLILPGLAIFLAIILYPFINSVAMSFTNKSMLKPESTFVGLDNYIKIITGPYFLDLIKNTFIFVFFATLIPFVFGFIWAVVLNQKFRGSEFLRGVTLVNWIIPGTCIGFLWMWIFNGEYGVLNGLLTNLNLIDQNINWMGQRGTAMFAVIIARSWQMLPWYMAFLIGGLQGVSFDQIEAARIDGANNLLVFRKIVLPEMKSIVTLVLLLGTIGNLQHFDLPWVMAEGGPARATTTLSIEVYRTAFKNWDMGLAATVGTIWTVLLACFSFIYIRKQNKEED
ncbi:sugar ABC transporter permease [Hydrogenoanaerobacterium sp.]|uniref:carbohydrate ABC transporter permease n=1 Tax=Hydrogenoanaerobacterium sp. TaxID=2953763 RepID=UPI00289C13D9|nr:sugar ABC transporter permease [Hydrogenoanaerobacterium sp.]